MWIKICGITRPEDSQAAAGAGADAVGFIFWPGSARYIDPEKAGRIAKALPEELARVGVFVNESAENINAVAASAGLTHIQLHGDEAPDIRPALSLPVIRAFRSAPQEGEIAAWSDAFAVLADGATQGSYGGTGTAADDSLIDAVQHHPRLILAGGLSPDNVAARIRQVRPWGIDASSGLEKAPGVKSHTKIRDLISAARAALAEV